MPEIREHEMEPQFEIFLFVPRIYHEVLKIWPLGKQIILFYFQFSIFLSTSSGERVRLLYTYIHIHIHTYIYMELYVTGINQIAPQECVSTNQGVRVLMMSIVSWN